MKLTFERIWALVRRYPGLLTTVTVFGLIMSGSSVMLPKLIEIFFKGVLEGRNAEDAKWIPFAFPALYAVLGYSRYMHLTRVRHLSEYVVADLRRSMVAKISRLNLTFHNKFGTGSGGMMSRVLNDTFVIQEGVAFLFDLVFMPLQAVALIGYMVYLDAKLTGFALLFLPPIALVIRSISRSLRKYGHLSRDAMENLTGTVKESLDGVRVIQSFNLESELDNRFDRNLNEFVGTKKKIINREEGVSPLNEFLASLIFMGFAIYAIKQVFSGHTSPGELIAFISAAGVLQIPIKRFQNAQIKLQQTHVVLERVMELVESKAVVPQATSPKPFPRDWKTIRFENVSFNYGADPVLQNVDLEIKRGEIIALVGESGSGKSTIVNMLERFFDPSEGRILIDSTPLTDFDLIDLRKNIALVTQDVFLFRDSIQRNIQAGDFSKDTSGVARSAQLANASTFIERMPKHYDSPVGDRGSFLSGGEKQRISIARAIFKDAPILILDEATSALDSVSEMEVQKGLNHLMEGRTAFVIAHRLSTVMNATRILVLKKGRVVEEGDHSALLNKRGEYFNFFQLQVSGSAHV